MTLADRICAALRDLGEARPKTIAETLNEPPRAIRCALRSLRALGVVERRDGEVGNKYAPFAIYGLTGVVQARPSKRWTPEVVERMTTMWGEGHSYSEIAAALGPDFTRNMVCGQLTRRGLTRVGPYQRTARLRNPARSINSYGSDAARTIKARAQRTAVTPKPKLAPGPVLSPDAVLWFDRPPGGCAWPVGGEGESTLSCGNVREVGKPYCAGHRRIAVVPAKPKGGLMRLARLG